jgi:hypothetical protein
MPSATCRDLRRRRARRASLPRCMVQRLDKVLVALAPEFSRSHLQG